MFSKVGNIILFISRKSVKGIFYNNFIKLLFSIRFILQALMLKNLLKFEK